MFVLMQDAIARADHELRMLETLVDCAHGLSLAFGQAAQAEADHARRLELFEAFSRGSLGVRMGIRLCMALRAPAKLARAESAGSEEPEIETLETDPADRTERDPVEGIERERERDREPVSLPKFLATLRGVAADASRMDLSPCLRSDVSTLQELLASAKADTAEPPVAAPATRPARPAGGVDLLTRPPGVTPRATLLGSVSAGPPRGAPPRRSG